MCNILSNFSGIRPATAPMAWGLAVALALGSVFTVDCAGQISNGQAGQNPQLGGDISNVQTVNKGQKQQTQTQPRTRGQTNQAKQVQKPLLPDTGNANKKPATPNAKKAAGQGQLGKPQTPGTPGAKQPGTPGAGAATPGAGASSAKRWEIGIRYEQIDAGTGVRITALKRGGAADRARLERGDVIVAVGGFQVGKVGDQVFSLEEELSQRADAQGRVRVLLQNYRDRRLMSFLVQLDEVKAAPAKPAKPGQPQKPATGTPQLGKPGLGQRR